MIRKQSPDTHRFLFGSPVSRPSPKLASSRLRQRLSGAATSQTSRRKPRYRQSDLFSNSSWLYYFTHYVLQCGFVCTLPKATGLPGVA